MTSRHTYQAASEQDARTIADALRQAGLEPTLDNRQGWFIHVETDADTFGRALDIVRDAAPPKPIPPVENPPSS